MGVQRGRLECLIRKSCVSILDGNLISGLSDGRSDPPGLHNQIWQLLPLWRRRTFVQNQDSAGSLVFVLLFFFFPGSFSLSYCRLKPEKYLLFSFNNMFAVTFMLKDKIKICFSLKIWGQRKQKWKIKRAKRDPREHPCKNDGKANAHTGLITRDALLQGHPRVDSHNDDAVLQRRKFTQYGEVTHGHVAGIWTWAAGLPTRALDHSTHPAPLPPRCYKWENWVPERSSDSLSQNRSAVTKATIFFNRHPMLFSYATKSLPLNFTFLRQPEQNRVCARCFTSTTPRNL